MDIRGGDVRMTKKEFESLRLRREDVLRGMAYMVHAAGMPDIEFVLRQQENKLDIVEVHENGRYMQEACIEGDSLTAMILKVLEVIISSGNA